MGDLVIRCAALLGVGLSTAKALLSNRSWDMGALKSSFAEQWFSSAARLAMA